MTGDKRTETNRIFTKRNVLTLDGNAPTTTLSIYCHTFQAAQTGAMDCVAETISFKPENAEAT